MSPERIDVEVDDRHLSLSNLDKVLFPATGFTKGEVIHYYAQIADAMLPHVQNRPMTVKRYPNGVDKSFFFEKNAPSHAPDWVDTVVLQSSSRRSRSEEREVVEYMLVQDRPTLVWAANLASIEFHVPQWQVQTDRSAPPRPDLMVFDLDPGPGTDITTCCEVARLIAERMPDDDLFPKTSGSKGLQLYVRRQFASGEEAIAEANGLAKAIATDHPDLVVSNMRKDLRSGRVLIDWSQNQPAKTTIAPYSLRARAEPTVSTPVSWSEVDACRKKGDPDHLRFDAGAVLRRVERHGDLMAGLLG